MPNSFTVATGVSVAIVIGPKSAFKSLPIDGNRAGQRERKEAAGGPRHSFNCGQSPTTASTATHRRAWPGIGGISGIRGISLSARSN
jgi:hypothetical protein